LKPIYYPINTILSSFFPFLVLRQVLLSQIISVFIKLPIHLIQMSLFQLKQEKKQEFLRTLTS